MPELKFQIGDWVFINECLPEGHAFLDVFSQLIGRIDDIQAFDDIVKYYVCVGHTNVGDWYDESQLLSESEADLCGFGKRIEEARREYETSCSSSKIGKKALTPAISQNTGDESQDESPKELSEIGEGERRKNSISNLSIISGLFCKLKSSGSDKYQVLSRNDDIMNSSEARMAIADSPLLNHAEPAPVAGNEKKPEALKIPDKNKADNKGPDKRSVMSHKPVASHSDNEISNAVSEPLPAPDKYADKVTLTGVGGVDTEKRTKAPLPPIPIGLSSEKNPRISSQKKNASVKKDIQNPASAHDTDRSDAIVQRLERIENSLVENNTQCDKMAELLLSTIKLLNSTLLPSVVSIQKEVEQNKEQLELLTKECSKLSRDVEKLQTSIKKSELSADFVGNSHIPKLSKSGIQPVITKKDGADTNCKDNSSADTSSNGEVFEKINSALRKQKKEFSAAMAGLNELLPALITSSGVLKECMDRNEKVLNTIKADADIHYQKTSSVMDKLDKFGASRLKGATPDQRMSSGKEDDDSDFEHWLNSLL